MGISKDKRRALRRWRSKCKWMRRLKQDQNEHGWRRDPTYYDNGYCRDGTRLCNCFFLDSKEAIRFKDTPTGRYSRRRSIVADGYLSPRDDRKMPVERENWHRRKRRREAIRRVKITCRFCGYFRGWVEIKVGELPPGSYDICNGCKRRQERVVWANGKEVASA